MVKYCKDTFSEKHILFSQQLNSRFCSRCHLSVIFLSYVTPAVFIFTLWNICIVQSFTAVAQHAICSPYKPLQDLDFYNVMRCSGKQQHPDGALCLCIKSAGAGCCLFPLLLRAGSSFGNNTPTSLVRPASSHLVPRMNRRCERRGRIKSDPASCAARTCVASDQPRRYSK